jgi:hypothetical protein
MENNFSWWSLYICRISPIKSIYMYMYMILYGIHSVSCVSLLSHQSTSELLPCVHAHMLLSTHKHARTITKKAVEIIYYHFMMFLRRSKMYQCLQKFQSTSEQFISLCYWNGHSESYVEYSEALLNLKKMLSHNSIQ